MAETVRLRLGDALLERGLISDQQLKVALSEQKRAHRPLGEILMSLGFVHPESVAGIMAENLGVPFVRARDVEPDPVLVAALEPSFVRQAGAFPIALDGNSLQIAMIDPGDPDMLSRVRERFPYPLAIQMITEGDLTLLIRKYLNDSQGQVAQILKSYQESGRDAEFPVERVTLAMLMDGVNQGATDIHIEPEEKITRIRFRIDGVLEQRENLPRSATEAIVSRLKILSELDIAERRRPQDGRLRIKVESREVDMRVSIMPCTHGENVVLRILDRGTGTIPLSQLGFSHRSCTILRRVASRPHGLFLVTGPTGSGKTTSLYSMLGEVDAIHRNVSTIEDPVEYRMPLIRQSQVENSVGYNFHAGLRTLLRQDPDVILVGEIRDQETADMAIKASMTGHLVFSTLHTNSAIGALPRLIDLGISPYLVEDALIGVLGQRLVRRVCDGCDEVHFPGPEELIWLEGEAGNPRIGAGCEQCNGTGLIGRTTISELFLPDQCMAELIRDGADYITLLKCARESGFRTMEEEGKDAVRRGVTTMSEVERVSRSHRLSEAEREDV